MDCPLSTKGEKVSEDVIETARNVGSYNDSKLEALRIFTLNIVENRGWVSAEDLESYIVAGFTKQNVLEILVVIAHKVLSNYTNHIVNTPSTMPLRNSLGKSQKRLLRKC